MKEYVSLQAVLDIVMQYCTDDDGSCTKADRDIRDLLDEIEALPKEKPAIDVQPVDEGYLMDWYISSVSEDDSPIWTEEHISELYNDFYIIPKDTNPIKG